MSLFIGVLYVRVERNSVEHRQAVKGNGSGWVLPTVITVCVSCWYSICVDVGLSVFSSQCQFAWHIVVSAKYLVSGICGRDKYSSI